MDVAVSVDRPMQGRDRLRHRFSPSFPAAILQLFFGCLCRTFSCGSEQALESTDGRALPEFETSGRDDELVT